MNFKKKLKGLINKLKRLINKSNNRFKSTETYKVSNKNVKVCCIGLGSQGMKLASRFIEMGYEVVGVCDLESKKLKRFSSLYPNIFTTTEISDIKQFNPDIAIVATLADNRANIIEILKNIGIKNVICEKPIVNSLDEKEKILTLVDEYGINIIINQSPKTWHQFHKDIKKIVKEEIIGNVVEVNMRFKSKGFGNIGVHYLSLISFILESKIKSVLQADFVEAQGSVKRAKTHNDLNGKAHFLLENGVPVLASNVDVTNPKITINFERGYLNIKPNDFSYTIFDLDKSITKEFSGVYRWGAEYNNKSSYMLDSLINLLIRGDNKNNFEYSLNSVEAIIAAQHSYKDNKIIELPMSSDLPTINLFS